MKPKKPVTVYVAVVASTDKSKSSRPHGDWASFLGNTIDEVVKLAEQARRDWEYKGHGPYEIFVGTITGKAATSVKYRVNKI